MPGYQARRHRHILATPNTDCLPRIEIPPSRRRGSTPCLQYDVSPPLCSNAGQAKTPTAVGGGAGGLLFLGSDVSCQAKSVVLGVSAQQPSSQLPRTVLHSNLPRVSGNENGIRPLLHCGNHWDLRSFLLGWCPWRVQIPKPEEVVPAQHIGGALSPRAPSTDWAFPSPCAAVELTRARSWSNAACSRPSLLCRPRTCSPS